MELKLRAGLLRVWIVFDVNFYYICGPFLLHLRALLHL